MLPVNDIDENEIRSAITRLGFVAQGDITWVSSTKRLYSEIRILEIEDADGARKFLLKTGGDGANKNLALNDIARVACADSQRFFQPRMTSIEPSGSILVEYFSGVSLSERLRYRVPHNPLEWRRKMLLSAALAGEWLQRFHRISNEQRDVAPQLTTYVTNRTERLVLLSKELQADLLRIVRTEFLTKCSVSHGDFTPQNILVDDTSLCVIDFGVREWDVMIPEWDLASLMIGMRRASMFSPFEAVRWLPFLMNACGNSFLKSYGGELRDREYQVALALRHFTYLPAESGSPNIDEWDPRSQWHYREFCRILEKLSEVS